MLVFSYASGSRPCRAHPPCAVSADAEGYVARFEVPGIEPEKLHVESEGPTLRVGGPGFERTFRLPEDADLTRTGAVCRHGILTVHVPLREAAKPREIPVTVS
jgi:HSP20 family molecular chaperone IbpA